jgi:aminoglycoside phosphotransferase (APT) family kinase protein
MNEIETKDLHAKYVESICLNELRTRPEVIERMKVGTANEVYAVKIGSESYIIRLNESSVPFQGSDKYIPLFKSLGIAVPDIIAANYLKDVVPINYQIQTRLEGTDIGKVIANLKPLQLKSIASEIAAIAKKLIVLPTNGKFGYVEVTESKLKLKWMEVISDMLVTIKSRTNKTGVVHPRYITMFEKAMNMHADYLFNAASQFYFDDMSSKNVIINNGIFVGIVDLDGVMYGDYLEGIGRIKASWYGTDYGDLYTETVLENLNLIKKQREMVTLYALFNRINWLSEIGIQFNQNTTNKIDRELVLENERIIDSLLLELNMK